MWADPSSRASGPTTDNGSTPVAAEAGGKPDDWKDMIHTIGLNEDAESALITEGASKVNVSTESAAQVGCSQY